jgi:hypothetical protein
LIDNYIFFGWGGGIGIGVALDYYFPTTERFIWSGTQPLLVY